VINAFKAVFWSFFGVRKRSDYDADAARLKPHHVIIAGLASAVVFVLALLAIVQLVTTR